MDEVQSPEKQALLQLLRRRGISDKAVLAAMERVPREDFVAVDLVEFAYEDAPLPIEEGQTISQPYIVALMAQALELDRGDRVLEIGAGSGYAAAVLSCIAKQVFTIERHEALARQAASRLRKLGYDNVEVRCGDGTLGWPEEAPFDAIVVAAGSPQAPRALIEQLAVGGRLVIPTGDEMSQQLMRFTRVSHDEVEKETLGDVRFVPLIGEQGWQETEAELVSRRKRERVHEPLPLAGRIKEAAAPFTSIDDADLAPLLERIGDSRLVLLGEASHGTAEFYEMRARISKALIEQKAYDFIAVEADWPDAAQVDHYVRGTRAEPTEQQTFARFPTWMWANRQVLDLVRWLRAHNERIDDVEKRVGFHGLDLYSMYSSIDAVIAYLDSVDKEAADIARRRYGCLSPWEKDPATYGAAARSRRYQDCADEVTRMLNDLLAERLDYVSHGGMRFLDASANARLVKSAEAYYRVMYESSVKSWNHRDQHMFDTLESLLDFYGNDSKGIVWAHNSHLGNAEATQMGAAGEINVGSLCREAYRERAYLVGFGTHTGTVAAASDWGGPMEIKTVRPSHPDSYERLCHDSTVKRFMLPLRTDARYVAELRKPRLERAIGVIYRPETELQSHYFHASLPHQFDEYIWFDETRAVDALGPESGKGMPDTFPFGL